MVSSKFFLKMAAKNFVFLVGTIFIFAFGFLYAYLRPQSLIFNIVFLVIIVGWVIYIIKYFWELIDKDKN